jgi:hypothetical protein
LARYDGGSNDIAKQVGAGCLDGVEVGRGKEHVEQALEVFAEVEKDKQGPVQEPCPCLELVCAVGIDNVAEILDFGEGRFPLSEQDIAGKLPPVCREVEVVRGREDEKVVEKVGSIAVGAERVLVLAKVVECVYLLE